ncbi:MAG: carbohydrate binding domain-containing protein [Candidatus Sumerlaeota bacterium]|nr:carbohydrate binding domain-containing protein [Candidatus Sumerlaeota bacterium]
MRSSFWLLYSCMLLAASAGSGLAAEPEGKNLLANGGFEEVKDGKPAGWLDFWSRDKGMGEAAIESSGPHGGARCLRIAHRGSNDWSVNSPNRLPVKPGDLFELQAWVKLQGTGRVEISATTYDDKGKTLEWTYGSKTSNETAQWRLLKTRFIIPANCVAMQPRLTGYGPATVWVDDVTLVKTGEAASRMAQGLPKTLSVANAALEVTMDTSDGTFAVKDKRAGQTWRQRQLARECILLSAKANASGASAGSVGPVGPVRPVGQVGAGATSPGAASPDAIECSWMHAPTMVEFRSILRLDGDKPEFAIELSGDPKAEMDGRITFPQPFVSEPGTYLVIPMNEGISYPVEDAGINPFSLVAYGGHGICMAFFGATDGQRAEMAILETPDDAQIRIERLDGKLCVAPVWDSQKKQFGYERKIRYIFFDKGGHVAMCKRYRAYAQQIGLLKTLAEKRKEIPNVDLLIGAVNVWCWDKDQLGIIKEMQSAGIERILWSSGGGAETIRAMNEIPGVLTSRYDIYQDLMDPKVIAEKLGGRTHGDWTQEGWPKDIMIGANGDWVKGWQVRGKDGVMYPCGTLCDKVAPAYARKRIPEDLKNRPFRCRFIYTTTASPWRECYSPDHPMTRTESRQYKMELLDVVSRELKLVTGCETGHDASVPFLHYYEGMMSLGPYRCPDSGRDMQKILDEVPERVAKFQLGHRYRLPLWELVYHDCVVAQWYWGDYNNKLPALWDKRDCFNALYGAGTMFMFNRDFWNKNKDRFAHSYKNTCPIARATGYSEMTNHEFLTPDRDVQRTTFANGAAVTVNFGDKPWRAPDGKEIAAMGISVAGIQGK